MPTKLRLTIQSETKNSLFVKAIGDKSNKPVGTAQEIPLEDWENTEKEFLGNNVWEITLDPETEKNVKDQEERINWLCESSRVIYVFRLGSIASPSIDEMFAIGNIATDYTNKFNESLDQMLADVTMAKRLLADGLLYKGA
jgi:hypothetical protein